MFLPCFKRAHCWLVAIFSTQCSWWPEVCAFCHFSVLTSIIRHVLVLSLSFCSKELCVLHCSSHRHCELTNKPKVHQDENCQMTVNIECEFQSQVLWCAGDFAFGYGISKLAGLPEKAARTNSIEVILCQALPQSAVEWQMQGVLFAWSHLVLQQCSPTPQQWQ